MNKKIIAVLIGAVVAFTAIVIGIPRAEAACDNVSIIRCGVSSEQDLHKKFDADQRGAHKVYQAFGISREDLNGFVDGTVYKDGRVVVDNQVVATNAVTAGYNWGSGDPNRKAISGTDAYMYSTSQLVSDARRVMVKMVDGQFKFAVIYDCGNPVKATPTPPPAKDTQVCELATQKIITIKENEFDSSKHSRNLKDCEPKQPVEKKIKVCDLKTQQIVEIKDTEYDESKHSKYMKDCEPKQPVVKNIKACDTTTGQIVTIREDEYDESRYTNDMTQCEPIKVCRIADKTIVTIARHELTDEYTTDLDQCKEKPPVTPVASTKPPKPAPAPPVQHLPETGAVEVISGGIGMGSLAGAGYYYLVSRRFL